MKNPSVTIADIERSGRAPGILLPRDLPRYGAGAAHGLPAEEEGPVERDGA